MKSLTNKAKLKNQKLRTLCTLDTSDIVLRSDVKQIINKKKHQNVSRDKKKSIQRGKSRSEIMQMTAGKQRNSQFNKQKWQDMAMRTKTPTSQMKAKRLFSKSRQRIKTQQNQDQPNKIVLHNLQIFTTVKNVKFQMDEQYNIDPFYLVSKIKSTNQQTVSKVKYLQRNRKVTFYIMKKSNHPKTLSKYEKQIAIKHQLTDLFKTHERKNFSCIYKVYRKDKHENMYLVYHMEGENLSWKKGIHKKLIHNLPKNNMEILKHLVVQIAKAIHILSSYGYYHTELKLKNILLELKQDEQNVKVSKLVKLGSLHKCQQVKEKKSLQKMAHSIYTPPQILNFIMFQNQDKGFNRPWLEYIYRYEDAWRINVWSLGILVLQLLNQQPLPHSFIQLSDIIDYQKQILVKSTYLLDKVTDSGFERLLKKMLSTNPHQRPSPEQIIIALTA